MKIPFRGDKPVQPQAAGLLSEQASPSPQLQISVGSLVRIAEEVWRLKKRLGRAEKTRGDDSLKGIRDSLARMDDALGSISLRYEDHDGTQYVEGLRLDIVHVEGGEPSIEDSLYVIETIRPTVYLGGVIVGTGQIILGKHAREGIKADGGNN